VPTTTITIYEVPNSYVYLGTSPTISATFSMVIVDGDTRLHSNEGTDPGSAQELTVDGTPVDSYQFFYDDIITINGGTETIKTFQLTIGGTTRSFVMSDDGPSIPGAGVGVSFTLDSYENYTPIPYADIACFVRGTRIRMATDNRRVEELEIGDLVQTVDNGLQPIRWIGRSPLSVRELLARPHLRPIVIPADSFGLSRPKRDLHVSPQHRVLIEGWQAELNFGARQVLASAKSLVGRNGIHVDEAAREVAYYHFMFDQHEVVFSESLPTESFLIGDTIRDGMDDAQLQEILELFPELATAGRDITQTPARPILKAFEARVLGDLAA